MQKKGSAAVILGIVLVIAAMAIGIFIGVLIGKSGSSDNQTKSSETVQSADTKPVIGSDTEADTSDSAAQTKETAPDSEAAGENNNENATVVMTVGGKQVSMDEVNVRLYTLRSFYIQSYGEEPWAEVLEDGRTVAETAKATLEDDIIRAEIFMDKASDYGIEVNDEVRAMCREQAESFIQSLGTDVTSQFGLTQEAVESVYIKYQVITEVTNAVNDKIREELLKDEANKDLDEGELDVKVSEAFIKQEETWKAEYTIEYSDIWENIVVGSVG